MNNMRTFNETHTAVAFPLGGIGTGNVSLGARGELRDWEIFNRPAKGNNLPNTFFAIRAQKTDSEPITRVIEGPLQSPHTLSHGYHPAQNAGLPRMQHTSFHGAYPFATIQFHDSELPVNVQLEAFTPLIPLDPESSGIPCAILTYIIENNSDSSVDLTLVGSLANPVGGINYDPYGNLIANTVGQSINEYRDSGNLRGLWLSASGINPDDTRYGNLALTTPHAHVTAKPAWLRGGWWDFLQEFWDDLCSDGRLTDLTYDVPATDRRPDTGSIGICDQIKAGEIRSYRFILSWYFPNRKNTWSSYPSQDQGSPITRNHYTKQFSDAWAIADYVMSNLDTLENNTRSFHAALFNSTLPPYVLDAISANIVSGRSNTCFWLEDGRFYGWEGCFDDAGCCAGTCTHVWSYAQTVAFLFPSLEREMRRIEFTTETEPDGYMSFRNFKSMGETFIWGWGEQKPEAAVDGQMGSILRAYREWQLSADKEWLALIWPGIKKAMHYAGTHWDLDGDHVLDGRQHNTYDIEFYGPNPLSSIYYLAALKAVSELAMIMEEPEIAQRCKQAFKSGSTHLDKMLWNGEYFIQNIDDINAHKYQHGKGCLSDQLLGQFHARILNLGDLLPGDHVRTAIKSIYDYNFRTEFDNHSNCQRAYVLNNESGLLLCTWPVGGRPTYPFVYSDEVWPGIEYHVASLLIYEGWLDEAFTLVKAVRDRHDGLRRNPWNEVECGHHYARSMSSWRLLLALSGVHCDLHRGTLDFNPVIFGDTTQFQCFWSTGQSWGILTLEKSPTADKWLGNIEVLAGEIDGLTVTVYGEPI